MIYSVLNCQEAYAKALLVPRDKLRSAQRAGDVLGAHRILTTTFKQDVEPLLMQVREEKGVPADPIGAYLQSGYEEKASKEREYKKSGGGGYQ